MLSSWQILRGEQPPQRSDMSGSIETILTRPIRHQAGRRAIIKSPSRRWLHNSRRLRPGGRAVCLCIAPLEVNVRFCRVECMRHRLRALITPGWAGIIVQMNKSPSRRFPVIRYQLRHPFNCAHHRVPARRPVGSLTEHYRPAPSRSAAYFPVASAGCRVTRRSRRRRRLPRDASPKPGGGRHRSRSVAAFAASHSDRPILAGGCGPWRDGSEHGSSR